MSEENKRKLFVYNKKVNVINMIDQNHLNNGGHDEFMIIKIKGYKSKPSKYCVIEYDIYGKEKSYFLTQDKLVEEFGDDILKKIN
jgi:hypothetical protein